MTLKKTNFLCDVIGEQCCQHFSSKHIRFLFGLIRVQLLPYLEWLDQKLLRCLSWPANVWFSLGAGKQQALISICTQEIKAYFVGARAQRTSDFVLELVIYGHFSKMPGNLSRPDRSETVGNSWLEWKAIEINGDYSWEMNMSLKPRDEWWATAVGEGK